MPEPESEAQQLPGARRKLRSRHDPAYGPTPVSAPAPLPQEAPPRRREHTDAGAPANGRANERRDTTHRDTAPAPLPQEAPPRRREHTDAGAPANGRANERRDTTHRDTAPAPPRQEAPRREPAGERTEGGAPPSNGRAGERGDTASGRRPLRSGGSRPEGTRRDRRRRRREEEYENLGEVDLPPGFDEDRPLSPPPPSGDPVTVSADAIQRERVDADAMRVTVRLARRGFEAYLVGGCVRDLLLGVRPKDFDVATAAHPRQIKRVFRNGRIIGRRFKLVHVVYGDKVVETSTFRAEPRPAKDDEDLLIVDDNEFGTAEQDARRRDFTINALFLDPLEWRILDYVGGLEDLDARVLRTIGEPQVRLGEDPVRILRAIKFATRLDFRIDKGTWDAMCRWAPELERSAPPRVAEEVLRLLRSGHSEAAFRLLHQCGALRVVLPAVGEHVQDPQRAEHFWPLLAALDREVRAGRDTDPALALALLYLRPVVERLGRELDQPPFAEGEILDVAGELLEPMIAATRLSRRDVGLARRLLANQRRFTQAPSKRFRPLLFLHSPEFLPSLELLRLVSEANGQGAELVETWRARHAEARQVEPEQVEHLRAKRRRRRRRT